MDVHALLSNQLVPALPGPIAVLICGYLAIMLVGWAATRWRWPEWLAYVVGLPVIIGASMVPTPFFLW